MTRVEYAIQVEVAALLDANPADWAARIRLFGLRGRLARLEAQVVSE